MTMGVKRLEDLEAFKLALEFKQGVYRLVSGCDEARRDYRFKSQLFDAAAGVPANIAEGWKRFSAGAMSIFLTFALSSLEEAKVWLRDGIDRGYFSAADCTAVLELGNRCGAATMALWKSLQPHTRKGKSRHGP